MNPLIETVNLSVQYNKVKTLNNINIQLPQNKKIAIIGPNGAGKSTFIKACLGLIPYDGQVSVLNQTIKQSRQQIAYVPQRSNVNWYFPTTVEDVVKMGVSSNRFIFSPISKEKKDKVEQALAIMKLTDLKDRQINQLSGGQKQRVFLARAIAQDAQAYFLDEPLAGIDRTSEQLIMQQLNDFQKQNKSSITVHHQLETLKDYFDYVVMINQQLITAGPIDEVLTKDNLDLTYYGIQHSQLEANKHEHLME